MFFETLAYAAGQKGGGGSQGLIGLIPLVLMFVIFYFLLIRPQQKQVKRHQEFIRNLKKGDRVVTNGGIHGTITGLTDTVVTLEVADNVRIKVSRNAIAGYSREQSAQTQ
ncbi:MAG: preprotein translocase subunit YajC [Deltaproteobacteria bacterium]|nr:MAG: preprotein translocase subunit YajC [Deltaproteobacteria bacterium]